MTECLGIWGSDRFWLPGPKRFAAFPEILRKIWFFWKHLMDLGNDCCSSSSTDNSSLSPSTQSWGETPEYIVQWGMGTGTPFSFNCLAFLPVEIYKGKRRGPTPFAYFHVWIQSGNPKMQYLALLSPNLPQGVWLMYGVQPSMGTHSLWLLTQETSWERKQDDALTCHWRPALIWPQLLGRYFHKQYTAIDVHGRRSVEFIGTKRRKGTKGGTDLKLKSSQCRGSA